MKNNIEILAPAGDFSALCGAISAGCDAVYLGTDAFNARMRAKNFTHESVKEAFDLIHAHGKKPYVTVNTAIYEKELDLAIEKIAGLWNLGADAIILQDIFLGKAVHKKYPQKTIIVKNQRQLDKVYKAFGAEKEY